jgi:DNA-binding protein H-NS
LYAQESSAPHRLAKAKRAEPSLSARDPKGTLRLSLTNQGRPALSAGAFAATSSRMSKKSGEIDSWSPTGSSNCGSDYAAGVREVVIEWSPLPQETSQPAIPMPGQSDIRPSEKLSCEKASAIKVALTHRRAYIRQTEIIKEFVVKSIESMTFEELIKTKVEIEATIYSRMQAEQGRQLKKAMSEIGAVAFARAGGNNGSRGRHALKGRKLPVRVRNPKNRKQTWAGRGLKPRWLVAALKGRKNKLADFAVG